MTVEDKAAPVLAYESAHARGWGPWVFRPSIRSIALVLVLGGCTFWLAKRHLAWVAGPTIKGPVENALLPVAFADDDRLVGVLGSYGAWIWDTHSGAPIASWGKEQIMLGELNSKWVERPGAESESFFLSPDGRSLAIHSAGTAGIRVYDGHDGRLTHTIPLPASPEPVHVVGLTREKCAVVLRQPEADRDGPMALSVISPDGAQLAVRTVDAGHVRMSADGRWLLVRSAPAQVLDAKTLQPRSLNRPPIVSWERSSFPCFDGGGRYLIVEAIIAGHYDLESWDLETCQKESGRIGITSPDGRRVAWGSRGVLRIWDAGSGRDIGAWPDVGHYNPVHFMPDSVRLLKPEGVGHALAIYEAPYTRPVATMGAPEAVNNCVNSALCQVSPSGRVVAVMGEFWGETRIFRKVGWECRESSFGVLGMPHCWLLLVAMAAAACSLWRDARKMDQEHAGGTKLISAVLILLGLAGTAKVLIDGCLGQWHPSPAPLLVLCGVAFATGGRGWRAMTLAIAAWLVPLILYAGVRAAKGGLTGWLTYDLFDRTYFIPRWSPPLALGVMGAALAAMVLALALRMRRRIA